MARIRPFRGHRYDPARAGDPAHLLAPPYDVVDDAQRARLAAASPHNCIHVILPEGAGDQRYANGAMHFRRLVEQALVGDQEPSVYVYHQRFLSQGHWSVRKGFVSLIELTRFGAGPVLPHERTLSGPKEDRLRLMRATDAHLELVFGMFSDPDRSWERAVESDMGAPVLDCDFDGCRHTLYRVSDPTAQAALAEVLAPRSIYIADGHHRYETMRTFADELAGEGRPEDVARWGMIFLSNLDDPGLVVLPTHRWVHDLKVAPELNRISQTCAAFFDSEVIDLPESADALRDRLANAATLGPAFALAVPAGGVMTLFRLRADYSPTIAGLGALPHALAHLDVVLLHELVLERALGISKAAQAAKTNLGYSKSTDASLEVARTGDGHTQLVCFMNPPRVGDVVAVCDSGEVMPQKSTFFYPKIPTGLVFRCL